MTVTKKNSLAALCLSALIAACGDSSDSPNSSNMEVVSELANLPKCTNANEGEQVWVKGESSARVCVDGKWFATRESSDLGLSCSSEELKDQSGLKIVCNGDSVGVVLNGSAGKDGIGISCTIAGQTDSSVSIQCGDSTMTLNLGDKVSNRQTTELDSEMIAISMDSLSGLSQKGPFLKGSIVYLYELTDGRTLKQTNGNFMSVISSDDGHYRFSSRNLVSQYALIVVDGKYRNEVTGKPTTTSIKLQAYTNMLARKSANVNLLTHLEKDRVYYLVTHDKNRVKVAKKKAQNEIFKQFHIDATDFNKESEELNVFGNSDADAALLAISILLQRDSSETDLSVLLTGISGDMESDGAWNDSAKRAEIAGWAATADSSIKDSASRLATFRNNVKNWGLGGKNTVVPDFEKYIRKFSSIENGLGVCGEGDNKKGTIKHITNKHSKYYAQSYTDTTQMVRFICDDTKLFRWRAATDIEKNTYEWGAGKFDGELRAGRVNPSIYYIYETAKKAWRPATTFEKDTYDYENNKDWADGSDGQVKKGAVTDTMYTFDKDAWRFADPIESILKIGCTELKDDSTLSDKENNIYICSKRKWYLALSANYVWNGEQKHKLVNTGIGSTSGTYGYWFDFDDHIDGGASRIVYPVDKNESSEVFAFAPIIDTCGGICGTYELDKDTIHYDPFVGVGFTLAADGVTPVDISSWGGICISYSASAPSALEMTLGDDMDDLIGYAYPTVDLPKTTTRIKKDFAWSDFKQPSWGCRTKENDNEEEQEVYENIPGEEDPEQRPCITISSEDASTKVVTIRFKLQAKSGTGNFAIYEIGKIGTCK